MIHKHDGVVLRPPEPRDVDRLYSFKNDPDVATLLGGFSTGYSKRDLEQWVEYHRTRSDETLWVIADESTDACLGHIGLYKIDFRARTAEFAIMLGDKTVWGKGLGQSTTRFVVEFGFRELNLNRIELSVLATNKRAIHIYEKLGFQREGTRRKAQFKNGTYLDVVIMGMLRAEFSTTSH